MTIKEYIDNMAKAFPITCDRYAESDGNYSIYGWIERKDGQRDFVLLTLYIEDGELKGEFCTSSAKYSKKIYEFLYNKSDGHNDCKKVSDMPPNFHLFTEKIPKT